MSHSALALAALLCLAASVAVARVAYARGTPMVTESPPALRWTAGVLVMLGVASVALATMALRDAWQDAGMKVAAFSTEVARLDHALRQEGDEAVPVREALFRYVDHMAREMFPHGGPRPAELEQREALGAALRYEAAGLAERGGAWEARDETLRAVDAFLATAKRLNEAQRCSSAPWCDFVLGSWLLIGFAALGLLLVLGRAGPATRLGLAAALLAGIVALDRRQPPMAGTMLLSSVHMEAVLHAITD